MFIAETVNIADLLLTEGEISLLTYFSKINTDEEIQVIIASRTQKEEITLSSVDDLGNFMSLFHTHFVYLQLLERRNLITHTLRSKFPGQTYMSVIVYQEDFKKFPQLDELRMQIALGTL